MREPEPSPSPTGVRVTLADDDPDTLSVLADIIELEDGLTLVGQATNANDAIQLIADEKPDVAVMDVRMPGGGSAATQKAVMTSPDTKVLVFSAYDDRSTVLDMIRAGVVGYLHKGATAEELIEGIRRAAEGRSALSAEASAEIVLELAGRLKAQDERERSRTAQEHAIREVMRLNQIDIVFQPIVDLGSGKVVGAEALSRFTAEPIRSPDQWFADAAQVGLDQELELFAIERALEASAKVGLSCWISFNLSPSTLLSQGTHELLKDFDVSKTVLEITEHARVSDYEDLAEALNPLVSRGLRLAVDDAGAGYSGLRHILRLSPHLIKIDMDITRGIDIDPSRAAMATALTSFSESVGAELIAEGIETPGEARVLRSLGVVLAQGYLFARPSPPPLPPRVGVPELEFGPETNTTASAG